ncbi:hypothetical protein JGUZn3_01400 [Entomobacter blattae]|uniref:IS6 family transposase n=1 Tax=Entomobacter blattae TaxID=2762277 RepID=A0A7H1NNP6_9PROT|nr:hypothetical protein JGUZn3_01400 [Entomobacter blattae]
MRAGIIRLAVMYYIRYPLSYHQVEDLLWEQGSDVCHETVRYWVGVFGKKLAHSIRRKRQEDSHQISIEVDVT